MCASVNIVFSKYVIALLRSQNHTGSVLHSSAHKNIYIVLWGAGSGISAVLWNGLSCGTVHTCKLIIVA